MKTLIVNGQGCTEEVIRPLLQFGDVLKQLPTDSVDDRVERVRALKPRRLVTFSIASLIGAKLLGEDWLEEWICVSPVPLPGHRLPFNLSKRMGSYLPKILMGQPYRMNADHAAMFFGLNAAEYESMVVEGSGKVVRELTFNQLPWRRQQYNTFRTAIKVFVGQRDAMFPPKIAREVADVLGAPLKVFPGAGHLLFRGSYGVDIANMILGEPACV